jgi:hypothetical protein
MQSEFLPLVSRSKRRGHAASQGTKFRVHMLKTAAGLTSSEARIEDMFPEQFYVNCVNNSYHLGIGSQTCLPTAAR